MHSLSVFNSGRLRRRTAQVMLIAPALFAASALAAATAASASTGHLQAGRATAAAAISPGKPVPRPPVFSSGAGIGAAIPAKPRSVHANGPLAAWSVSLAASSNDLWPTQYSTLTATASQDVGPTPYYLRIYDETAGAYVVTCASGTTCAASVTQPTPTTHYYVAVVSYASAGYPPAGEQARSAEVGVLWHGVGLTLSATPPTLPVGGTATLTATTTTDVGPSPFWTEIFDATTGTRIASCGSGTSCSTTVSQSVATTHRYVAYVSGYSTAFPPAQLQETSAASFVTWSNLGWRVSLNAPAGTFGSETVTATASADVGPTPYYIEIFDEDTGTLIALCGTGSSCSATFTPSFGGSNLVAFVSLYDTSYPPSAIVASSNEVTSYLRLIP